MIVSLMSNISRGLRFGLKKRMRIATLLRALPPAAAFALAGVCPAFADSEMEIRLALDKPVIELGRQASLTVTVTGASGFVEPDLPEIDGLDIIARGRTQSVQIINMKVKSSKIFGYAVEPRKPGRFTIGPIRIERRGKVHKSNSVELIVLESPEFDRASGSAAAPRNVIVEATVDKADPYIGQQVTLIFRFARRVGARIRNAGYQLPELPGFWNEGMESKREYKRNVDGLDYVVTEVAIPLFPIEIGTINIDRIEFYYDESISRERSRRRFPTDPFGGRGFDDSFFDSFFQTGRAVRQKSFTAPIEMNVRPLPTKGRPEGFKGGVGSFDIKARLSDDEVKEGESVTLTIVLSGQGNIRDVADPKFEIGSAKTYSDTPAISVKSYSDKVVGEKTYKVAVVPQGADEIIVPKISTPYFNPETGRYEVASSAPLRLKVLPSEEEEFMFVTPELARKARAGANAARRDILPIHERYGSIESDRSAVVWRKLRPIVYPLPLLAYALCLTFVRRRERLQTDVEYRRRRFAAKTADTHIETAARAIGRKDWDEVFTGCSRAVTEYLADRLNVPAGGMTPADVGAILSEKGMAKDFAAEILRFLEGCDYGRFASPAESRDAAVKCVDGARRILDRLKREEVIR